MAGNGGYETNRRQGKQEKEVLTKEPLVTVVIPVHNGADTLPAALDSALIQDVSLEVIVVDDCSKDGIEAVRRHYENGETVRFVRNPRSLGAAKSRNRAVREAKGAYVAFLDADDYWAPGKLKKQLDVIRQRDCVLCCTGRELMDADGRLTGRVIGVKETVTYRSLLSHNSINCSSVLLKRDVALEFPMEHEDSHEDYITWLKILRKYGPAAGINEPLLKYRLTGGGKSGHKWKSAAMTLKVYRYMGFGPLKSLACFVSYALHGVVKYLASYLP